MHRIALDVAGNMMYWVENGGGPVRRANLNGTDDEIIVPAAPSNRIGIALDLFEQRVYWADSGTSAAGNLIQSANLDGSSLESVITGIRPFGLALEIVPEPSAVTLVALGLTGLIFLHRSRLGP